MGIKFRCPNGHKLNVKSFLGGKRAFCPKCGVNLVVPTLEESMADGGTSVGGGEMPIEVDDAPAPPGVAQATFQTRVAQAPIDPIAEAPNAVWYVRPATGGQFGPASGEVMRAWLDEGRVAVSSLVWRAGWPEWRAAAGVFPQLAPGAAAPTPATTSVRPTALGAAAGSSSNGPPPIGGSTVAGQMLQSMPADPSLAGPSATSSAVPALSQTARRRRRQNDRRLYASAVLVAVSMILLIVLFVVFKRQGGPADPETQEAPPAAEDLLE